MTDAPVPYFKPDALDLHTLLAIETYHKLDRAEAKVAHLRKQLEGFIIGIPDDEMDTFISLTTDIKI